MTISTTKDPNSTEDFVLDWSLRIGTDTIASAAWTVSGVTLVSSSATTTTTTARISGGTVGTAATATCRVTLASGQIIDKTIRITVQEE